MATWGGVKDFSTNEALTASMLDTYLSGNTEYLLNSRQLTRALFVGAANVTLTGAGSDSFQAIDSTNLKITITPKSTRVAVELMGSFSVSAGIIYLDFFISGLGVRAATQYTGTNTNGLKHSSSSNPIFSIQGIITGLTPDTLYTITPYWRQSATGNTLTWANTSTVVTAMTVREI